MNCLMNRILIAAAVSAAALQMSYNAEAQELVPIFGHTDKAVLTLNDGTVINGYNRLTLDFGAVVGISEKSNGTITTYKSADIKSLDLFPRKGEPKHYETTRATLVNTAFAGIKEPKFHPYPLLLQVVFQGKYVTGYVLDMDTPDEDNTSKRTYLYYYKVNGTGWAEIYWEKDSNQFMQGGPGMKKQLKKEFSQWPDVAVWFDTKEYSGKKFTRNPLMVLEVLDSVLARDAESATESAAQD